MAMEINSVYSSYASSYTNATKKEDSTKAGANTKESNVTTTTVELKTSTAGVTKTEQIKT